MITIDWWFVGVLGAGVLIGLVLSFTYCTVRGKQEKEVKEGGLD